MAWRKIKETDIVRGTVVCFTNIQRDGGYGTATIIQVIDDQVTFSRPMAYAHEHFNSNTGLLSHEVFTAPIYRLLKSPDVEVFEETSGKVRGWVT